MEIYSIWNTDNIFLQGLETVVLDEASKLSKRGRDAFYSIYNIGSIADFAYKLLDQDFKWSDIPRLGGKTLSELSEFSEKIIALFEQHSNIVGLEEWERRKKMFDLGKAGIEKAYAETIYSLWESLGYLPVFSLISSWIMGLSEREKYICDHGMNIWATNEITGLDELAKDLGVTAERARQLRVKVLTELKSFISSISIDKECPYDCLSDNIENTIREKERVSFNANFIRFVAGTVYPYLSVAGNVDNAILVKLKGGDSNPFITAVPSHLCSGYDFNEFLQKIGTLNNESRTERILYPLPEDEETRTVVSRLAYLRFGWISEKSALVIPPNADKNLPDIMEDIIRESGHPMTIDEIMNTFSRRYPGKIVEKSRIRGNMQLNPRITPIGRSGIYSLSEWTQGSMRGGTIRLFVKECLDASESHIVPVAKVLDYVRQYRPTVTQTNLTTNIMLESSKAFVMLWKGEEQFITYSSAEIPEGFKRITRSFTGRRSFEESVNLLFDFIEKNKRAPKTGRSDEEARLARFITNQRSLYRRGLLDGNAVSILETIESKLSALNAL